MSTEPKYTEVRKELNRRILMKIIAALLLFLFLLSSASLSVPSNDDGSARARPRGAYTLVQTVHKNCIVAHPWTRVVTVKETTILL